ncbi:MAG: hypothetical protein JNJ55_13870 [Betaproteobacteria bacterium]|nr:hypothetical protein [Betaproteobacteria bacterium]
MKTMLKPLAAACLAALTLPAHAAISQAAQSRPESVEVIVDSDVVIETETRDSPVARIDKLASAGDGKSRSEVRVFSTSSGGAGPIAWSGNMDIDAIVSNAMSEAFAGGAVSLGKSVKNSPYSAEIVTERTQMLADGNQITKRTTSATWRDSAGRTRQETRDPNGNVKSIHIFDAVDGTRTTLSPSSKTARKMTMDRDLGKRIEELKERAKSLVKDGQATIIERGKPGEEIVIKRIERPAGDGKREISEDVNVSVIRAGGDVQITTTGKDGVRVQGDNVKFTTGPVNVNKVVLSGAPGELPALGDLMKLNSLGTALGDGKWAAKATTTSLGIRDFDGVRAEGKSTSYTIPAGEIGNKNAITVSTESWYSSELQATVYSKHSDPRNGETVYRMTNIKRGEPSAALFTVPEGYSIKETPGFNYSFRTEGKGEKK